MDTAMETLERIQQMWDELGDVSDDDDSGDDSSDVGVQVP